MNPRVFPLFVSMLAACSALDLAAAEIPPTAIATYECHQSWVGTLDRGMVRAYLCGTKVAGFGFQEINALYPAAPGDDFTR